MFNDFSDLNSSFSCMLCFDIISSNLVLVISIVLHLVPHTCSVLLYMLYCIIWCGTASDAPKQNTKLFPLHMFGSIFMSLNIFFRLVKRRNKVLWTGMRAATHWATRTTDFLPRHITTVARTGRKISSIFFWRRPLIETKTSRYIFVGCVDLIFIISILMCFVLFKYEICCSLKTVFM